MPRICEHIDIFGVQSLSQRQRSQLLSISDRITIGPAAANVRLYLPDDLNLADQLNMLILRCGLRHAIWRSKKYSADEISERSWVALQFKAGSIVESSVAERPIKRGGCASCGGFIEFGGPMMPLDPPPPELPIIETNSGEWALKNSFFRRHLPISRIKNDAWHGWSEIKPVQFSQPLSKMSKGLVQEGQCKSCSLDGYYADSHSILDIIYDQQIPAVLPSSFACSLEMFGNTCVVDGKIIARASPILFISGVLARTLVDFDGLLLSVVNERRIQK